MANKKFSCPLCGKIWYNEKDLAACVSKDAAEAEKVKSEACRKSDYTNLMKTKKLVEDKYEELRKLVYTYNCEAQNYATKYEKPLSRYDITCACRTVGSNSWLCVADDKCKELSNSSVSTWKNELRDIIRKELNF